MTDVMNVEGEDILQEIVVPEEGHIDMMIEIGIIGIEKAAEVEALPEANPRNESQVHLQEGEVNHLVIVAGVVIVNVKVELLKKEMVEKIKVAEREVVVPVIEVVKEKGKGVSVKKGTEAAHQKIKVRIKIEIGQDRKRDLLEIDRTLKKGKKTILQEILLNRNQIKKKNREMMMSNPRRSKKPKTNELSNLA